MARTGRPTDYSAGILTRTEQYLQECVDEFESVAKGYDREGLAVEFRRRLVVKLPSVAGLAVHLKCARSSIYEWAKQHPDFSDMLERILAEQEKRILENGLSGEYNSTISKLVMAILAITHDIYVHRRVHAFLKKRDGGTHGEVGSSIVVRSTDYPLANDPPVGTVSAVEFKFCSTGGDGAAAIRAMADAARRISDASLAGKIRRKIGDLRRAMSLPCGLKASYEFLEQAEGQAAAEDFLQHRSESAIVALLKQSADDCESDGERSGIRAAEAAVNLAFKGFETDTPIGSMLAELAAGIVRKSTRTLIAFSTERDRRLGEFRIAGGDTAGLAVRGRLKDGHIRITTAIELENSLIEIQKSHLRDYWRRLVVVSPTQEQLSVILGKKWLPAEITVVCDRELVARIASTYRTLSQHPDLAGADRIGSRLAVAAQAAHAEAEARLVPTVDLELTAHRPADRDEEVIDLVNSGEDDETGEIVELSLESGRKMRARPGTLVIRHDAEAEINPFDRLLARDVRADIRSLFRIAPS